MLFRKFVFVCIAVLFGYVEGINAQNDSLSDSSSDGVDDVTQQPNTDMPVSGTLSVLHIETDNRVPVTSKTTYLQAKYWLVPTDGSGYEALGSEAAPLDMQIRGRGHSSWKSDKKPYKLRLADKMSVMGMAKNRHWALLKPAEATVAGLRLGTLMGMAWTPDYRPVEVVLNGDNIGLYFLTETIRIDKNRVDIYEQADGETDPELVSGGWLVEVDNYIDDHQITFRENSHLNLTLKYHSPENLSGTQLSWLTSEFKAMNAAIYATDKTSKAWEDYMDVESMAKFFIIQEVMDNPDGFHGSFYLHKDLGDDAKWVAGPVWDLVCYNREKTDYTFRMKVHYTINPHWIGEIIQYDSFCQAVKTIWADVYPDKLSAIYDYIDDRVLSLDLAWQRNQQIWNEDPSVTVHTRAERLKTALHRNIEWFNAHLPQSKYTSINGQSGADEKVRVYHIQGTYVGEFDNAATAVSHLKKGLYIIGGRKVIVR